MSSRSLWWGACALLVACGTPAGEEGAGKPAPSAEVPAFEEPRGPCEAATRVGGFSVEAQADFGIIQGVVSDGVVPTSIPEKQTTVGSCVLLKRRSLVCSPACVGGETCGEEGKCIPYPREVNVGTVSVHGLLAPVSLEPAAPGNKYAAFDVPNPPFSETAEVSLTATGGSYEPLELFGRGLAPLAEAPAWELKEGQDLAIHWTPGKATAGVEVRAELTVDQHGLSPLSLVCSWEDTGEGVVGKALVNELLAAGVSGFPNGRLTRRTVDHVDMELGCVEFAVAAPRKAKVSVAGSIPCDAENPCGAGQSCNATTQICE